MPRKILGALSVWTGGLAPSHEEWTHNFEKDIGAKGRMAKPSAGGLRAKPALGGSMMEYKFPPDLEKLLDVDPVVVDGIRRGLADMSEGNSIPFSDFDPQFRALNNIP